MAGKSETFIKLGLVFFIALLSFSVGTLVGKQYSDRQYKLSKLEPTDHNVDRTVASEHQESTLSTEPKSKLSDEEIAKLAEEFVTDDSVETAKNQNSTTVPAIEETQTTAAHREFAEMNDEALQAAQKIIENKLPAAASQRAVATAGAATTHKAQAPQAIPQNAAQDDAGKYTVQVGSYVKETEARTRAEGLKAKGYAAFYVPGVVEGKTFYRVNVGTYATIMEAKQAVEKIAKDNNGEKGFIKEIR